MLAVQKNFSGRELSYVRNNGREKSRQRNTALHLENAPSSPHSTRGVLQGGAPRGEIFICDTPARFRRKAGGLINDHRSESVPDHRFGAVYHLIDDAGGAHQSVGLTDRFTSEQAHLFEVPRELWSRRESAKPLHRKFLSIKTGLTNHRQLRIRNDLIGRRMVTPFPFLHDAVAQPASRSIGEFRTKDQMASRISDAGGDDSVLVLWMGIGLEAREEASPHPDRVGAERQRSSNGPAIGNATGSDDRHGREGIDDCREQRECRRGGA